MHQVYIQKIEEILGKEYGQNWFYSVCMFWGRLLKERGCFICDFENLHKLIPGTNLSGKEQRPFSDEELDKFFNSKPLLMIKDYLCNNEGFEDIETLNEYNKKLEIKIQANPSFNKDVTKNVKIICYKGNKRVIDGDESGLQFFGRDFNTDGDLIKNGQNRILQNICEISENDINEILKNITDIHSIPKLFEVKLFDNK